MGRMLDSSKEGVTYSREDAYADGKKIKGVTLRNKVKCVDIRKELGVNIIQEKVREMTLRLYGHM